MTAPTGAQGGPSLPWRVTSSLVMGMSTAISKAFLYGCNKVEVHGLQRFLEVLDSRADSAKRQRGLITVSNHISVLDDPVMWGVLPLSYAFNPMNARWGLGAHDICFKNKAFASFFTYGQVLPTHRLKHSANGGLFQPTLAEAVRLLSSPPHETPHPSQDSDPFTSNNLTYPSTYSTTGTDSFPSPSLHQRNRHAWIHVFPEGAVHQHPNVDMRYFKWGVSRLILESDPVPDVLPIFIDGFQHVMPEDREFPRFLPRVGSKIKIAFGDVVDAEAVFGDLRSRWRALVEQRKRKDGVGEVVRLGELGDEELRYGTEAREIRIEVARRVRDEVLKLRKSLGGYDDPDLTYGEADTWANDKAGKKKYQSKVDGSLINQD